MESQEFKIGEVVRSYDFCSIDSSRTLEGEQANYIEGIIEDIMTVGSYRQYVIRVHKDVTRGHEQTYRVGQYVYPPVNGSPGIFASQGVTNYVEKIK